MNLAFDLKYASRLLRKSWGYSLLCASVVTFSVGLAIWTWVMSENQVMRPLGLPGSSDWYSVQIAADATAPPQTISVDAYTYQELLENNRSADHIGAFAYKRAVLSEGQASTNLRAAVISPRLLAQVTPLRGRTFQDADGQPGAAAMAIISFDTWQNYFAADPAIIGKTARIDAAPVQIVGVMPKEFYAFADFELWLPLRIPQLARPQDSTMTLSPFIVPRQDQNTHAVLSEMKSVVARVNKDYPDRYKPGRHVLLIPGHRMFSSNGTPIVVMIMCISVAVLLLGGVNISFVFLARLLERSRELALRSAVGSTRARLLGQCLLETALVVLAGLVVGYGLAVLGVRWTQWVRGTLAQTLATGRLEAVTALQPSDFIAAVFFAILIWLLSTLIPAWRVSRQDAAAVLAGSGKGTAGGGGRNRSVSLLVGLQVAVSCFVLVVCATMVLAINQEVSKPTGLDSARVLLSTSPTVFTERFSEPTRRLQYWEALTAKVGSAIPGVGVAYASAPPTRPAKVPASIETQQGTEKRGAFTLPVAVVSENYFRLLGLTLRSGRLFDSTDTNSSLNVAVIDEELAARYWPGQDVLGKSIQLNPSTNGPRLTVVGVVSAVADAPYSRDHVGVVYQSLRQAAPPAFHLLAKLPNTVTDGRTALRAAAFAVDRDLPINNLQTLDDYLAAIEASFKAIIPVVTVIAIITALIAASGLIGLISRSVALRTQEVGIRRALGATPRRVISMFLRQAALYMTTAIAGVGLGVMLLPPLSRVITNILDYTVPVALGVVVFMAVVIFAASYLPSRRAVALEPADALRYE
ncbi:MAG TPA: FtsX-like permease family protein [Thermoanaerobaculia bacterium]|nr:FtsX-like permease family protein [Thermoanaerobaculia bacterium]